jgi:uncharacterized protein (TIRG00374 family)
LILDKINPNIKRALKYALSFIIAALFLFLAFMNVDAGKVIQYTLTAIPGYIILFICIFLLSHFLRALRWKYILSSVKQDVSVKNLFGALMIGYGVNCVVPRLGEVTRAVLVGKWEGLSRSSMFGTVILERVIDTIFFVIALIISFFLSTRNLLGVFPWLKTTMYIASIGICAGLIFVFFAIKFKQLFIEWIIKLAGKFSKKGAEFLARFFDTLLQGFASLKGWKNYCITIFISICIILLYALNSYIGFLMLGFKDLYLVDFGSGWIIMSLSSIATAIPTPGSTGSYHLLVKSALTLLFGMAEDKSLAYAFLTHIISYIMFIFTSLFFFFTMYRQKNNINSPAETNTSKA